MTSILRPLVLGILFFSGSLFAESNSYSNYFQLLDESRAFLGPKGDWEKGEIEIITDPGKMRELELSMGRKVGLVEKDKYFTLLNDAVRFPGGSYGIYTRILSTPALKGIGGVAILCATPEGKIVLNCNYRHSTRSWEIELPRGLAEIGETVEDAARRELLEETGMVVESMTSLGEMAPDSGALSAIVPVVLVRASVRVESMPEEGEAIADVLFFDKETLFQAIREGKVSVAVGGRMIEAHVRDPFLTFAILQAQLRYCLFP